MSQSTCPTLSPSPHANRFEIDPAVINNNNLLHVNRVTGCAGRQIGSRAKLSHIHVTLNQIKTDSDVLMTPNSRGLTIVASRNSG